MPSYPSSLPFLLFSHRRLAASILPIKYLASQIFSDKLPSAQCLAPRLRPIGRADCVADCKALNQLEPRVKRERNRRWMPQQAFCEYLSFVCFILPFSIRRGTRRCVLDSITHISFRLLWGCRQLAKRTSIYNVHDVCFMNACFSADTEAWRARAGTDRPITVGTVSFSDPFDRRAALGSLGIAGGYSFLRASFSDTTYLHSLILWLADLFCS